MKVLLLEDIQGTGKRGEIKVVKDGYGQNFLIKKGKAKLADKATLRQYEAEQKRAQQKIQQDLELLKQYEAKLSQIQITIKKKTGDNGTSLFGAITKDEVALALKQQDINIDKKMVEFDELIKHTGEFRFKINLGHGHHPSCSLMVEKL